MNSIGLITALTTVLTIWFGHVLVRKIEARIARLFPAIMICFLLGLMFGIGAWVSVRNSVSAVSGIIAITFLWDALEFVRQEKRVKTGHAPANSANPRHARILTQYPKATKVALLEREPRGNPYTQDEIEFLLQDSELPIGEQVE